MKKGMIPKFSMALALAAALALGPAPRAHADLDGAVDYTAPKDVLVMPFDVTQNHESFQLVSRIGESVADPNVPGDSDVVATHWAFWSKDCAHLADVLICLTPHDTVVVNPRALRGERQTPSPPQNVPVGPTFDLSDNQGIVVVTAYVANTAPGGLGCSVPDPSDKAFEQLVGAWTIADTSTNAAFGSDAIGLDDNTLPTSSTFFDSANGAGGIFLQTFNPDTLGDSDVILFALEEARGAGRFRDFEIGPIANRGHSGDTNGVECDVTSTDNVEIASSHGAVGFDCALFATIDTLLGGAVLGSSGFLHLSNCTVLIEDPGNCGDPVGNRCPIEEGATSAGNEQFIFGYHGQAVGQFGAVVSAKYSQP